MTAPEWLRPSQAAARFGVSRQTLDRWAAKRWVGRSQPGGPGTPVLFRASDISALIAAHEVPRTVVSIAPEAAHDDGSWRNHRLWKGASR